MILHAKRYLMLTGLALAVSGAAQAADDGMRVGVPHDWSHRHLIYSNPDTPDEAVHKGTLDQWVRNYRDPRFVLQLVRKMESAQSPQVVAKAAPRSGGGRGRKPGATVHRDWSNVMGGASGVGNAGTFPAKYNFDINAVADCANDFVVFTTSSSGNAGTATTFASRTGTFTNDPGAGTVTITNGARTFILTRSTTQNTGLFFQTAGSNAARATNLANAIARNGGTVGVTATSAAAVVTVRAITVGAGGNAITLAEGISNFTWAGGNLQSGAGTAGQPTIIAFNQLYSSCGTTPTQAVPATFWSYVTGTAAFTETSPVISLDGSQVAFVQRTGTAASLVVLRWSSTASVGTVGAPTTPTNMTGSYFGCTAPCMTIIPFSGGANNTNSSPYYDYATDELYVGANNGTLHKFSNIFGTFGGEPALAGAPWPVTVATGVILSSPVFDGNLVFVGSARNDTTGIGGMLHSVDAGGTVVSSGVLSGTPASTTSTGVADSPIVDSSAQRVYAFVASDTSSNCGGVECQAIYQFPTNAPIAGLTAPRVQVGRGQYFNRILYAGVFDNAYYTSADWTIPSGSLYVCGSLADGSNSRRPTLWRIPITNNAMGVPVVGPQVVSNSDTDECSPITGVMNGANEYLFVSVPANGNDTGCTGACIYMYNLTGIVWGAAATASAGLPAAGGTGGIIIDNISSTTGASQVYYSTLTSPGNAVQASQAGLN